MKPNLHPTYGPVIFRDKTADTAFLSNSTPAARRDLAMLEWEDGETYPVFDVSAASHPFWTGTARVLDTEGRVEKFRRRYARG